MVELGKMETEKQNPNTMNLDEMSIKEALTIMNSEDKKVAEAIGEVIPEIEEAVQVITSQLKKGGETDLYGRRYKRAPGSTGCGRMPTYIWHTKRTGCRSDRRRPAGIYRSHRRIRRQQRNG